MTSTPVLRLPGLRRLTATLLLSSTAEQFTLMAMLWFVAQGGYPAAALGAVVLCLQLPTVVAGPIAGRLLDRWSPARLMMGDNVLRAAPRCADERSRPAVVACAAGDRGRDGRAGAGDVRRGASPCRGSSTAATSRRRTDC